MMLHVILPGLIASLITTTAIAMSNITPHVGLDYKNWQGEPKTPYEHTFPTIHSAYNVYVGARVGDGKGFNYGLDIGWERSNNRAVNSGLIAGDQFFSATALAGDQTHVAVRLQGVHVDFNLYYNLMPCFDLIGHIGAAQIKPHADISYATGGVNHDYFIETESKLIGRFGFGAQWMFLKWFGVRGLVMWDGLQHLTFEGQQFNPSTGAITRVTEQPYESTAVSFHLGIVVQAPPIRHF